MNIVEADFKSSPPREHESHMLRLSLFLRRYFLTLFHTASVLIFTVSFSIVRQSKDLFTGFYLLILPFFGILAVVRGFRTCTLQTLPTWALVL